MTHVKLVYLSIVSIALGERHARKAKRSLENYRSVLYDQNIIWSALKIVAVKVKPKEKVSKFESFDFVATLSVRIFTQFYNDISW